jgi:hypothetical protein
MGSDYFYRTFIQGIYQVVEDDKKELKAVNFLGEKESDLANPSPVNLKRVTKAIDRRSINLSLWTYLLLLSLLLLFLEWLFNPPVARFPYLTERRGLRIKP